MSGLQRGNFDCFVGDELGFWLDKARGLQPTAVNEAQRQYVLDEADQLAFNNGGIAVPKELTIKPGKKYFRFFTRKAFADYGNDGWHGSWWIDEDVFMALRVEASEAGEPLTRTAGRRLAVPEKWSDMAMVVKATPKTALKVWWGKGKVAHPDTSPVALTKLKNHADALKRRPADGGLVGDAPHMAIAQYFVPGERGAFKDYFLPLGIGSSDDTKAVMFDHSISEGKVTWQGGE